MIEKFEQLLEQEMNSLLPSKVTEAMAYSLLGGGKRVRPQLMFHLLKDFDVHSDQALYAAAALECIHTYSLIHDDLPALDNDSMRRFKPTNHIVFGEDIAILAGDGLLTLAFSLLAKAELDYRYFEILSRNAGVRGMILGQEIDIKDDIDSLEDLKECYALKTGALFSSALEMALLLSNQEKRLADAQTLGENLGMIFQIQDDLLEVLSDSNVIGKSTNSDVKRDIATISSFLSIDASQALMDELFQECLNIIDSFNFETEYFKSYIKSLNKRSL